MIRNIIIVAVCFLLFIPSAFAKDQPFISSSNDIKQPVVVAEGKRLFLAYINTDGKYSNVYLKISKDEGNSWLEDKLLSKKKESFCYPPAVIVDNETIHIAWMDYGIDFDGELCYVKSADCGKTWQEEKVIMKDLNGAKYPLFTGYKDNVYLAWIDIDENVFFKASHDSGLNWENEKILKKLLLYACFCYPPGIAVSNKDIIMAYPNLINKKTHSYIGCMKSSDFGRTWCDEKIITKIPVKDIGADEFTYPVMIGNGSNLMYMFWIDKRNFRLGEIFLSFSSDNGKTWGKEKCLVKEKRTPKRPSAVLDENGCLHVVWMSHLSGKSKINYIRSVDGGKSFDENKSLTEADTQYHDPVIAITPSGILHVFWFDESEERSRIYYKKSADKGKTWQNWDQFKE